MRTTLLAIVVLTSTNFGAAAQDVDPRCSKVRDKVGCTCAVRNGGHVAVGGTVYRVGSGSKQENRQNERYFECLRTNGDYTGCPENSRETCRSRPSRTFA